MPDLIISDRLDPLDNAPAAADSIGPAQGLKALRRNWRLLLVCALTFGVFGYVGAKVLLPQQFTASGAVAVDNRSVAVPALEGALKSPVLADPMPVVRSEVAILQSPALIRSVVRDLKLQNDPNFNTTLRPPPLLTRLKLDLARMLPTALSRAAADFGYCPTSGNRHHPRRRSSTISWSATSSAGSASTIMVRALSSPCNSARPPARPPPRW